MTKQQMQQLLKGSSSSPAPVAKPSSGLGGNLADNLAGGIGGTIGQALGTPFDLVSGPGGTMAGGAIGGGLAQGGAEAIQELLSGKGLNGGQIASQGAQGAALGAIPLVDEARTAEAGGEVAAKSGVLDTVKNLLAKQKPLTAGNVLKRTALRAGTGAIGGGVAQAASNLGQGKPIMQDVPQAAGETAASNTIIPGVMNSAGRFMKGLGQDLSQRSVGGPIAEIQGMFNKTASEAVGDYPLQYAMEKGIIPTTTDETGKLQPEGLMTPDYIDTAIAKRKQVASQVESKLQALLPSKGERPVTNNDIKPIIDNFIAQNYEGIKGKTSAFLSDIKRFASKTPTSDEVPTKEILNLIKGGGNKRLDQPTGSVGTVNALKRIAGRGYNEKNPNSWTSLYEGLRDFVEKNSKDPQKVSDLNAEHAKLRMARISLNKWKHTPGKEFPIPGEQAVSQAEHARFGPTVGLSAERAMPPKLLAGQSAVDLLAALAGYHLGGGLPGGVGGYLLAGQARAGMNHFTQNPDISDSLAKIIKEGGPTAQALQSLLQQKLVHNPLQQNTQSN